MPRLIAVVPALLMAVFPGSPARAETFQKTIMLPDYGSPAIARNLYSAAGNSALNGMVGYVFPLQAKSWFSIVTTDGATGVESFDVFFYDGASGPGNLLEPAYNRCPDQQLYCNKSGLIPPGARWAIVTLVLGAYGSFSYTAS